MSQDLTLLRHYLAPLSRFLVPDDVTEVVVNRPGEVGVETGSGWTWHDVPELDPAWLQTLAVAAAAFTQQDVRPDHPLCSTTLPGDIRCQIVMPPAVASAAPVFTLRRPSSRHLILPDLEASGLFAEMRSEAGDGADPIDTELMRRRRAADWTGFFRLAVRERRNIVVSGATGSGKTTFAKVLTALIPEQERLVTIEDARELVTPHRNAVHLIYAKTGGGLANVDARALLESALRMRPDRVLMQELRDDAAYVFLRNVNTGHPGSITTIHADSAALAFEQMILLVRESESGRDLPRQDIRTLLTGLIDVVVQMKRDRGRFRVTEVWHEPAGKRIRAL